MTALPPQLIADAAATEECLAAIFDDLRGQAAATRLVEAMAWSALDGGKRVRAGLVLGAARLALGRDAGNGALRVAAAFECLHAYSLIHDDLPAMDDADLRRGKPACHIQFDEATAILAGDALQTLAFTLLSAEDTHPDAGVRARLVETLAGASGVMGMAGGQMLDLEAETRLFDLDETTRMQALKTGALIRASARAGGVFGGADETMLKALEAWSEAIGLAFQIADDLLDRQSSAADMGKPTGRDANVGKASVVTIMGADAAENEARRLIDEGNAVLRKAAGSATPWLDYMLELSSFIIRRQY
ncbi:MAG: polyprenyl synthetase family protein [Candidatus Puniceispirillales bacterium]